MIRGKPVKTIEEEEDVAASWMTQKMKMMKQRPTANIFSEHGEDPTFGSPWVTLFQEESGPTKIAGGSVKRKKRKISSTIGDNDDMIEMTTNQEHHQLFRGDIHSRSSSTDHFSTRNSLNFPVQHYESLQQNPFKLLQLQPNATNTTNLISVGSKIETLFMVGAVVGLFGLAMLVLACFMSGRDVRQKCCCGCCCCSSCTKGLPTEDIDDTNEQSPSPPTCYYATVQAFVFDAEHDTAPALVVNVPTTMEKLFPDLLATSTDDLGTLLSGNGKQQRRQRRQRSQTNNCDTDEESNAHTAKLCEPLL
jgi:hypothetical protein